MNERARWKELCMDTTGGDALGRFWAAALGLRLEGAAPGDLIGETEGEGIALCEVPEAKTVKHRVHLDVHVTSVAELQALGASVVLPAEESGFGWTVMADPEGGEFCAFVRDEVPRYRLYEVCVDAADGREIATWWAEVLGGRLDGTEEQGWYSVEDVPGMPFECLVFGTVPEPKTVKNRIHWDLYGDVATLESAGATVLRPQDEEIGWTVMADPEGNEFCVFAPVV